MFCLESPFWLSELVTVLLKFEEIELLVAWEFEDVREVEAFPSEGGTEFLIFYLLFKLLYLNCVCEVGIGWAVDRVLDVCTLLGWTALLSWIAAWFVLNESKVGHFSI